MTEPRVFSDDDFTQDLNERWEPWPGGGGRYEVSDLGRVRRVGQKSGTGRVLTLVQDTNGYLFVNINKKRFLIHHLVADTFMGPPPANHQASHRDKDRFNNRLDNLFWTTQSGVMKQAWVDRKEEKRKRTQVPDSVVLAIRADRARGDLVAEIAARYGTSAPNVSHICNGRTRKRVLQK